MLPFTIEESKSYHEQKVCYIFQKEFNTDDGDDDDDDDDDDDKIVRFHCHFTGKDKGVTHNKCNLNYRVKKEISVFFHDGSTYDYNLIIKKLAGEFKGEF